MFQILSPIFKVNKIKNNVNIKVHLAAPSYCEKTFESKALYELQFDPKQYNHLPYNNIIVTLYNFVKL